MSTTISSYGHSCIRLERDGHVLVLDPGTFSDPAALDGAGAVRSFFAVTLPGLRPVMLFITTTTVLASAHMFGQSYLLTKGGPGNATRTAIMYIADQGLSQNNMAPAAAMSYVLFAFLAVISIVNFRLQRERLEKGRS